MMHSQNYSTWHLGSGEVEPAKLANWSVIKQILSKKFVASHELTLSFSCLLAADNIDNVLMTLSFASYDKISPD